MAQHDSVARTVLPIPNIAYRGLTTYDAKDPDTKFPRIMPFRPLAGAPVSTDYAAANNAFTGRVKWVEIALEDDDHTHLIPPEEHLNVIMFRQ